MADQGRWFKLWASAPYDPDLANLPLEDFARWCLLGLYLKVHSTDGCVRVREPGTGLVSLLRFAALSDARTFIQTLPNCIVSDETVAPVSFLVTWRNWAKYQGDLSTDRVRAFRRKYPKHETPKKRREETRGEETRTTPPTNSPPPDSQTPELPPEAIRQALARTTQLRTVPALNRMAFWRANIRATNGHVDYPAEILKAEAWLSANPARAPRKDLARFLHNWLARAGDRA